jgi:hypothetical protein
MKILALILAVAFAAACKKPDVPKMEDPKASDGPAPAAGQVKIDTSMSAGADNIRKAQEAAKQMGESSKKSHDGAAEAAQ